MFLSSLFSLLKTLHMLFAPFPTPKMRVSVGDRSSTVDLTAVIQVFTSASRHLTVLLNVMAPELVFPFSSDLTLMKLLFWKLLLWNYQNKKDTLSTLEKERVLLVSSASFPLRKIRFFSLENTYTVHENGTLANVLFVAHVKLT